MKFEHKLVMYARLLVERGMNVQSGQFVMIAFESGYAEELALLAAHYAYERGARHVNLVYNHPRLVRSQLTQAREDDRFFFPSHVKHRVDQIVDSGGCYLNIRADAEPYIFNDIQALAVEHMAAATQWTHRLRDEGVNKGKVAWCLANVPSPKAAAKIFPELGEKLAYSCYWEHIFDMTMTDTEECLSRWHVVDATLHRRREKLNALRLRTIKFVGPGTNLRVGLSPEADWIGGSKLTTRGQMFTANIPSYEVFTSPDHRLTEGHVTATRPFKVAGVLVEGLVLHFEEGKIVGADAKHGLDAYMAQITMDDGACRLGEVALVGMDTPIARHQRFFHNTLFDENAACHIATGSGYSMGIRNGWGLTRQRLDELGLNQSGTHSDVMISSPEVNVYATTYDGSDIALMRDGLWVAEFA